MVTHLFRRETLSGGVHDLFLVRVEGILLVLGPELQLNGVRLILVRHQKVSPKFGSSAAHSDFLFFVLRASAVFLQTCAL